MTYEYEGFPGPELVELPKGARIVRDAPASIDAKALEAAITKALREARDARDSNGDDDE